jgi:AcrR family transcriptional regulator
MRLTAPDRKKQLIDIAMKLFSEQGFDGTSTRQIAEAAGINESIIFRHFRTKEDLFWAVLSDHVERRGRNRRMREVIESQRDFRQLLIAIAEDLLNRTSDDTAVTRLLFFSALRNNELTDRFFRTYAQESFEMLAEVIREGMAKGRFRRVDPLIAARSFIGMVVYHYLVQEIFGGDRYQKFSVQRTAEELVDIFIGGIAIQPKSSNGNSHSNGRKPVPVRIKAVHSS